VFWRKNTYIFSDQYESLTNNLFAICKLENQKIKFVEVCNVSGRQLCIKRRAIMKELFSNNRGDIFFRGICRELKKERFF
jgi:hypothetical protein